MVHPGGGLLADRERSGISRSPVFPAGMLRSLLAPLGDTRLRQRIHGVALMVMGGVALSTGLLVLDPGLASIVGAGMGGYGAYLCLR